MAPGNQIRVMQVSFISLKPRLTSAWVFLTYSPSGKEYVLQISWLIYQSLDSMYWKLKHISKDLLKAGIILMLLAGCAPVTSPALTPTATVEVDPVFREFYLRLGGETTLGRALLPMQLENGIYLQYTAAALMEYDPKASSSVPYALAPLGEKIFHSDIQGDLPDQSDGSVVNGFVIFSKFTSIYQQFGASQFAGNPLSQPMVDWKRGIILQYFQNVGLYTSLTDTKDGVHLLAYGSYDCRLTCSYSAAGIDSPVDQDLIEQPFLDRVLDWGFDLTGKPLGSYYSATDGSIEQVYEHVVLFASPGQVQKLLLRSLPAQVGIASTALVAEQDAQGLTFVPVDKSLGHNVATIFMQYIQAHGGESVSGLPTTEIFSEGNLYRQCFTNYCLDYDPDSSDTGVQPAALGEEYLKTHPNPAATQNDATERGTDLKVTVNQVTLSTDEKQTLQIRVIDRKTKAPVVGLDAKVTVTLPDGSQRFYSFPGTDAQGASSTTLDAIQAANGTIIPFSVCLVYTTSGAPCQAGSFVIWTN